MTQLRKITISNIRRFSKNVELNISPGATVILAPNGTGKTSIFESIEFALTGGVKRLGHPPTPIIRDLYDSASICLDFDADQYCKVVFDRKSDIPIRTTTQPDLFANVDPKDLPFLFRLTHLLDQNSRDWLVHCDREEAGNQIATLSFGKDATLASSKLTSLKRGNSNLFERLKAEFEVAQSRKSRWDDLLSKRNALSESRAKTVMSKERIRALIFTDATGIQQVEFQNDTASLKAELNKTEANAKKKAELLAETIIRLATFDEVVRQYLVANAQARITNDKLDVIARQQADKETEVNQETGKVNGFLVQMQVAETSLQTLLHVRNTGTLLEQNRKRISELKIEEKEIEQQFEDAISKQGEALSRQESALENRRLHSTLQARARAIETQKQNLLLMEAKCVEWEKAFLIFENLGLQLVDLQKAFEDGKIKHENAKAENTRLSFDLREAQISLEALTNAKDGLEHVVSELVSILPENQEFCPVCGVEHGKDRLKERIAKTLDRYASDLFPASERVRAASQLVDESHEKLHSIKLVLEQLQFEISSIHARIEEINKNLPQNVVPGTPSPETIRLAKDIIEKDQAQLDAAQENLDREILAASTRIDDERFADIEKKVEHAQEDVMRQRERVYKLESSISNLNAQIDTQEQAIANQPHGDALLIAIQKLEKEIVAIQEQIRASNTELASLSSQLSTFQELKFSASRELENENRRLSELLSTWERAGLKGVPDIDELAIRKEELNADAVRNADRMKVLAELHGELAIWESYDQHSQVEVDIIEMIVEGCTEVQMTEKVNADLAYAERRFDRIKQQTTVLNTFARHLDIELKANKAKINALNPTFNEVSSRIIIDPRFTQVAISSGQHYRKNFADVQIPLHNTSVKVSDVASEAQMTDVQLSFLLAMARQYKWSPWRALLLDDPTQHHDLVHASGVFDILRDFIADHGFQIIMATHDATQAKFFMRKLENDGLPCKLYTLKATDDGVIAS